MAKIILSITFLLFVPFSVYAALIDRGNGLIYDDDRDITWLADANLASSQTFDVPGINPDGSMFGATATQWISAMNLYQSVGYLGFNNWRLANNPCDGVATYNCTISEYGHLFYDELSGVAYEKIGDSNDPDLSKFTNITENSWYWSGSVSSGKIEVFNFGTGASSKTFGTLATYHVWAVHDGDIGTVPLPAAVWLFGSGLLGMIGLVWRKGHA